jgi:hypothetical protein
MSPKSLRFVVSTLLLGLSLLSLPVEARPMDRRVSIAETGKGSGILSTLRALFASLWPGDGALDKEGMSIDPNGAPGGANAAPGGDEGVTIDPNG